MRAPLLLALLLPAVAYAQGPLHTLTSPNPQTNGSFGSDVAGVPDVDGDGRGDGLVGAEDEAVGGHLYAGRAYLFNFSGATGTLLHVLESPYPEFGGLFGRAVSGVEDVDGDGHGDLLVGAPQERVGAEGDAGRAYVFSGSTGHLLHTLTSPNPESNGYFGHSVSGLPDVDGDGRADLLVGAQEEDGGAFNAGRAYLFSGATGVLLHSLQSPNPRTHGWFGVAVSGVPDVDGDGCADLLFGSNGYEALLYSGATGAFLRAAPDPENSLGFSNAVAGAEDVDGDGRGDLLVGDYWAGRAYLFSGATGALLRVLHGPPGTIDFGDSVAGVPDVDGDGRGDLLVGESGGRFSQSAGHAYLYSGATGALLRAIASPSGEREGGFGQTVSGVPDVDGDGRDDLLVGAPQEDEGVMDAGRAHLFSGTSGVALTASGSPTVIPPGGTVTVTATASNANPHPVPLDLWVVAERNGNAVLTRLVGRGTLPAGATITRSLALTAPSNTPPGTYRVHVRVGDLDDGDVHASDAFGVTVTGAPRGPGAPSAEPSVAELFGVEAVSGDVFAPGEVGPSSGAVAAAVGVSPNPFTRRAVLSFELGAAVHVRIGVYDALGREVSVLLDREVAAGRHEIPLDGSALPSGAYLVRLQASGRALTRPVTVLR